MAVYILRLAPESRKAVVGYSYSWMITALWDSGGFWTTSFDHQQPTSIVITSWSANFLVLASNAACHACQLERDP